MKKLTSEQIIRTYIDFFVSKGHLEVESSSLIPHNDPSVLWVNAGVTPLKKYFDGSVVPPCRRLTSCQKCIRTNDIENVGVTARHHTFFQMLGNFSIGDYFKKEALTWAFELLTSKQYFDIDVNKLYVTVYPTDLEAYNLWVTLGIDPSHIVKLEGNYWEIGEGPSGPDSEIFYDRGEKYDKDKLGIKLLQDDIENDRYIEIWNNVFSQYNAKKGVPREEYEELPSKNIDTGMGVERMACIFQNAETNYETDLFLPMIHALEEISGLPYNKRKEFKVIVDHIRTLVFALSDGATFENYGRGYVLRRLLRRSVRMGRKLNIEKSFLGDLVDVVVDKYSAVYPYLLKTKEEVREQISKEEDLFKKTLKSGEKRLEEIFSSQTNKQISGLDAFKLYDTYGFPIELTEEAAEEKGFTVNIEEFQKYMDAQKEMARQNRKVESSMNIQNELLINYTKESNFIGYDTLGSKTEVLDIIKNNEFVDSIIDEGYIFIKDNPFYAESGGQVADKGYLKNDNCKLEVLDVIKAPNKQHLLHVKVLEGTLTKGEVILTHVLQEERMATTRNHSATHILQKTLQDVLGDNVHQAGSRVDENTFRFDFIYHGRLSDELIEKIEDKVNEKINQNIDAQIEYLPLEEAKKKGAMALFENKYGNIVRVVTIGDSVELCGGTHVKNTKDIGKFAIVSLENKGADTFRLEGATNNKINDALKEAVKPYYEEITRLLEKIKKILTDIKTLGLDIPFNFDMSTNELTSYKDVVSYKEKVSYLKDAIKELERKYIEEKTKKSVSDLSVFLDSKEEINGINVVVAICENYETTILKQIADAIDNKLDNAFILLANINGTSVNLIAKSSSKVNAGTIVKEISLKCNGNGGGSPKFAQGGGNNATDIAEYLAEVKEQIKNI